MLYAILTSLNGVRDLGASTSMPAAAAGGCALAALHELLTAPVGGLDALDPLRKDLVLRKRRPIG